MNNDDSIMGKVFEFLLFYKLHDDEREIVVTILSEIGILLDIH